MSTFSLILFELVEKMEGSTEIAHEHTYIYCTDQKSHHGLHGSGEGSKNINQPGHTVTLTEVEMCLPGVFNHLPASLSITLHV